MNTALGGNRDLADQMKRGWIKASTAEGLGSESVQAWWSGGQKVRVCLAVGETNTNLELVGKL